jgi:hypothetical protein
MGCPICSSTSGHALREALGEVPVAHSLLATALPFVILAVIVAWLKSLIPMRAQAKRIDGGSRQGGNDGVG